MHAILMPVGSYGDVHPYVGLGLALQERGHRVTVHCCGYFRELFERAGLEFVEFGSAEEYLELAADPRLWHPRRGFAHIFENAIAPRIREQYDRIATAYETGETVVLAGVLAFGARVAQERLGVPFVSVHLQPAVLWSDHESPRLGGIPGRIPWLRNLLFRVGERYVIDRTVRPHLEPVRGDLGLPQMRRTLRWWHSTDLVLCLFPEWFAPRQPDWPEQVACAGFPLWDEGAIDATIPTEVESFLAEGPPTVVFTPGSANMQASRFFVAAVDACRRMGRRGLLISKFPEQIPADLPPTIRHVVYVPFSRVFARAAAVVHHGGIGTTAQCLRAGVPQLVMPMSHDQPDNAERLQRLGVGDRIGPRWFSGARVANSLERLLGSHEVSRRCNEIANRFEGVDPVGLACEAIEAMFDERCAAGTGADCLPTRLGDG